MPNAKRPLAVVVSICAPAPVSTFNPTPPVTQIFDRIDQMAQVATKSIKFPQHECVAGLDRLETGRKAWTVVTPARGQILIDTGGINTGGKHRIPLRASVWVPSDFETRT
jgi:hypothetical protein